jgi:hypothetical protein
MRRRFRSGAAADNHWCTRLISVELFWCSGWSYLMSIRSADSRFEDSAETAFHRQSREWGRNSEFRMCSPPGMPPVERV